MASIGGSNIVKSGLVLNIDAANNKSITGSSSITINNLVNSVLKPALNTTNPVPWSCQLLLNR